MAKTYSKLLSKFSSYNDLLKKDIVKAGPARKVFLLAELFLVKLIFVVMSFPFFLFVHPKYLPSQRSQTMAVDARRFQQVLVLSFFAILALVVSFQILFRSLGETSSTVHPAAPTPLQFSGKRDFAENTVYGVQNVSVSPFDHTVTFRGNGPSFAHVALYVDDGESFIATTQVNSDGAWTFVLAPDRGTIAPGMHSVFAVFYGDDKSILGQPSSLKTFEVPLSPFSHILGYFGFNSLLIVLIGIGVLGFSVVQLRKTVTA